MTEIVPVQPKKLARIGLTALPRLIVQAGERATRAFLEFFTATIRNRHTRQAYARACARFRPGHASFIGKSFGTLASI